MAARLGTPPPPSGLINSPPTPRLGFEDNWEPYAPRKSNRQRAQRAAQTPPPYSSSQSLRTTHSSPPATVKKTSSTNMPGTTISPPSTISKKRTSKTSHVNDTRRVSGALNEDSMASAAAALGIPPSSSERKKDAQRPSATTQRMNGMLPTPAKTPKKRSTEAAPGITSIARNLFPVRPESVDEVMPSPKKGRKKYSGFTLDSFGAEDEDSAIQIYTDSHERIPEIDTHPDNPFYGHPQPPPEPTKRASKRRKVTIPGEGEQTLEEAEKRGDGLVYVFRGKKVFRKFSVDEDETSQQQANEAEDEFDAELDATVPARLRGPLTRSSIKPRLLFPTPEQAAVREMKSQLTDDDEEAVTDIEESLNEVSTPTEEGFAVTPRAPKFAPFSPPPTARATRSGKKVNDGGSSPLSPDMAFEEEIEAGTVRGRRPRKVSPFDSWRRTKGGVASKKREGESMGGEVNKKQRA